MRGSVAPINLAGSVLGRSRHVCAFFHDKQDEYRVLLPFITDGFRAEPPGDSHRRSQPPYAAIWKALARVGIDVATAEATGQLEVRRWEDAYLRDGHFDQDRMLGLIEEVLKKGKEEGYPLTRLVANMEWALEADRPGVETIRRVRNPAQLHPAEIRRRGRAEPTIWPGSVPRSSSTSCARIRWSSSAASCRRIRSSSRPIACCASCGSGRPRPDERITGTSGCRTNSATP